MFNWVLESTKTLEDGEQLLCRVPDLDVWVLVLLDFWGWGRSPANNLPVNLNQKIVSLSRGRLVSFSSLSVDLRKMVWITQSWCPCKVLQETLVLLDNQVTVVLVKLRDLLQFNFFSCHLILLGWLFCGILTLNRRFEVRGLCRHTSLNVNMRNLGELFTCYDVILKCLCSTFRDRAVAKFKRVLWLRLEFQVLLKSHHRAEVPFEGTYNLVRGNVRGVELNKNLTAVTLDFWTENLVS